jgi:hypothetical protein
MQTDTHINYTFLIQRCITLKYIEIIFPSGIVSMEIRISDLINIVFTKETGGLEYEQANHCKKL